MTSQPGLAPQLYPSLRALTENPVALSQLGKVLAGSPTWRYKFMSWLALNDVSGQQTYFVMSAIRQANGVVEPEELRTLIGTQINQRNYDKAYYFWLDSLSPAQLRKLGELYDGQFTFDPNNLFFGWNLAPIPNVDMLFVSKGASETGRELRLSFINNEDAFAQVYQFLHLRPGTYVLKGEWSSSRLATTGGLQWNVSCLPNSAHLGNSQAFTAASPISTFSSRFSVPDKDCDYQMLQLANASKAVLDRKIAGEIFFRDLSVTALP